ncbi:hypothetical protein D3C87_573940 [compost metagenome]
MKWNLIDENVSSVMEIDYTPEVNEFIYDEENDCYYKVVKLGADNTAFVDTFEEDDIYLPENNETVRDYISKHNNGVWQGYMIMKNMQCISDPTVDETMRERVSEDYYKDSIVLVD